MGLQVNVTFKQNDRDVRLYLKIKEQGDRSNFVKDAVEFYLNYKDKQLSIVENKPIVFDANKPVMEEIKEGPKLNDKAKNALDAIMAWGDD